MKCKSPVRIYKNLEIEKYPDGLEVPCGKCLSCKVKKRSEWALRLKHELYYHENSCFITLTYDEDSLPENNSLVKRDLQNFFKRLRKNLKSIKIKYFAVGEYGDKYGRPHYHIIMFGLGLSKLDKLYISLNWRKGLVDIGQCNEKSIHYTTSYINKVYDNKLKEDYYDIYGLQVPFKMCSNGLGKQYALDNREAIEFNKKLNNNGYECSIPRYYLKVLGLNTDVLKDGVYAEEEKVVKRVTGVENLSRDEAYKKLPVELVKRLEDHIFKSRLAHDKNLTKKVNLFTNREF